MNGEILSIETTQKISRLEKENREYEKIICNFDKEINRQFNIIKDAINLIKEELADVTVMLKQIQLYYNISSKDIREVMNQKIDRQLERIEEVKNAK